jgi:hypothetical protein
MKQILQLIVPNFFKQNNLDSNYIYPSYPSHVEESRRVADVLKGLVVDGEMALEVENLLRGGQNFKADKRNYFSIVNLNYSN